MFNQYISQRIKYAEWRWLVAGIVILLAYSFWAFNTDSPWTRALMEAGGTLPEMRPGFPAIEPGRTFSMLGEHRIDYIFWQLLDIPYIVLNIMTFTTAIGVGLNSARLSGTVLKYAVLAPFAYGIGEAVENSLLTAFALNALAPEGTSALIQQFATTIKHIAALGSIALALLSLGLGSIVALSRRLHRQRVSSS
ncbi:MAG: hypothetical protein AAF720_07145 [Pseudomonadota bacterium]